MDLKQYLSDSSLPPLSSERERTRQLEGRAMEAMRHHLLAQGLFS